MIATKIYLCVIPYDKPNKDVFWGNLTNQLKTLMKDALSIEARLERGVSIEVDRSRYLIACSSIDAVIPRNLLLSTTTTLAQQANIQESLEKSIQRALDEHRIPFVEVRSDYLGAIAEIIEMEPERAADIRLGMTFFPPDQIGFHRDGFGQLAQSCHVEKVFGVQRRLMLFELAEKNNWGIVEIQDGFQYQRSSPQSNLLNDASLSQPVLISDAQEVYLDDGALETDLYDALRHHVTRAITADGVLNIGNYPHYVITEVLNEFVYKDPASSDKEAYIRISYSDGSQGAPFPLRCLPLRPPDAYHRLHKITPVRFALMSMRHLQMDHDVDVAWFRNQDVQKARTFGETDSFCYQLSKEQFQLGHQDGPMVMHLLHTGLPSAVIGFYRALVEELLNRVDENPSLIVVPYYFKGNKYLPGKPWR